MPTYETKIDNDKMMHLIFVFHSLHRVSKMITHFLYIGLNVSSLIRQCIALINYQQMWNQKHFEILDIYIYYESNQMLIISFGCNLPDFAAPYRTDNGPVYLYVRFRKMNFCKVLAFRRHPCESFNFELLDSSSSISRTLVHNWEISPFSWVI